MKSRVIIFEGPDCVGKTTVARALSERLHIPIFKNTRAHEQYRRGELRQLTKYGGLTLVSFLQQVPTDVIFDRFHLSERAYALASGREYDEDVVREIDNMFASLHAVMFVLFKDYDKAFYGYDTLIERELAERAKAEFSNCLGWTNIPTACIDMTDQNTAKQLDMIEQVLSDVWGSLSCTTM